MIRVKQVKPLPGWRLEVQFSDGLLGEVSLQDRLFGPMFEPLRDPALFSQVSIDDFGVICWPNGADLTPDALYQRISTQSRVA